MEVDEEVNPSFMLVNTIKCKRRVLVFLVSIGVTKFCMKVLEKMASKYKIKNRNNYFKSVISVSSWKIVQT